MHSVHSRQAAFALGMSVVVATTVAADCSLTSTGNLPLPDMGTTLHGGLEGGLYPGGTNYRPANHLAEGTDRAQSQIVPRAGDGTVDLADGKVVLISVGMSNTTRQFAEFVSRADVDPAAHPQLKVVDGAQGGNDATNWSDASAATWTEVDNRLSDEGVTPLQVQVAWIKQAERRSGAFPSKAQSLQGHLEGIARALKTNYPNIQMAFFSSRTRAYTDDVGGLSPEPTAYETSFAVKWMVEKQIDGHIDLDYAVAPWISWGPYLWVDGLDPRSDGMIWECDDTASDFTHPSPSGIDKVADHLMAFFKTDPTTRPWFVKAGQNPPTITQASASPAVGDPPMAVDFSVSATDANGIAEYLWTFGDGTFSTQQNPTKVFSAAGSHDVHLAVIDNNGNASFVDLSVNSGVASIFSDGFEDGTGAAWTVVN